MSRRLVVRIVTLALAGLVVCGAVSGKAKDSNRIPATKLMIKAKLPGATKAELAMTDVPFAPGAPAVVLLEAAQQEFKRIVSQVSHTRTTYLRRVKILKDDAVATESDYTQEYGPKVKLDRVQARTILPDGTIVDAGDGVHTDETETQDKIVSVAFPQVRVGAILELLIETHVEGFSPAQWIVQEHVPVLDSRFILSPPPDLQFSTGSSYLTAEEREPIVAKTARGLTAVWHFTDVPALPDEPHQPPLMDMAKALYIIPTALSGQGYHIDFASDWSRFNKDEREWWENWLRSGSRDARALAEQVAAGADGPVAKAEAIRRALRARVRVLGSSYVPIHASPDETLASGTGTTADLAGTAVAMLRGVDVDACVVETRRREDGKIPEGFPVQVLLNETLVRIEDGGLYFSPASDAPVTLLPAFARGVVAMPIDGKSTAPVHLPDFTPRDNRIVRVAKLRIGEGGRLEAEATATFEGLRAAALRDTLRDVPEDRRRRAVEEAVVQRYVPSGNLTGLGIEALDDDSRPLVLKVTFTSDDYVVAAGKRTLVNLLVLDRVSTDAWSAPTRSTPIDLGAGYEAIDRVSLELPSAATGVETPEDVRTDVRGAGSYSIHYGNGGGYVSVERHLRLDGGELASSSWTVIQPFFSRVAAADDRPVVLTTAAP